MAVEISSPSRPISSHQDQHQRYLAGEWGSDKRYQRAVKALVQWVDCHGAVRALVQWVDYHRAVRALVQQGAVRALVRWAGYQGAVRAQTKIKW